MTRDTTRTQTSDGPGGRTRARQAGSAERKRRRRTISISSPLSGRGQTNLDFVVGIGIFILAVAFVFAFLPTIITPFDTSTGGAETAQADRIADRVVEDVSTAYSERPNEIVRDEFEDYTDKASHELAADWGLRSSEADDIAYDQVNVSIQHLEDTDGEPVDGPDGTLAAGDEYDGQAAASAARIVTVVDGDGPLESDVPAYRLVVRVW